jgi:FG-GAP repeat
MLAAADLDGDGRADLAVSVRGSDDGHSMFETATSMC